MRNFSKIALCILSTLVASNLFAQCRPGSPCYQASQGGRAYGSPYPSYESMPVDPSMNQPNASYVPDYSSGYSHGPYEVRMPSGSNPYFQDGNPQNFPQPQMNPAGQPMFSQDMGAPMYQQDMGISGNAPIYYENQPPQAWQQSSWSQEPTFSQQPSWSQQQGGGFYYSQNPNGSTGATGAPGTPMETDTSRTR